MMRHAGLYASLFALAIDLALSSGVSAATVNAFSEKVLINRGTGYVPVGGGTTANPGDMVMASPSGSGEIVYDDGCRKKVAPGTVVTVAATSPCSGSGGQSQSSTSSGTWYVLGAAAIGGIAAGAVLATGGSSGGSSSGGSGGGPGGPASP